MKSIGPEPEPEDEQDDAKEKSKMFISVFKTEETEQEENVKTVDQNNLCENSFMSLEEVGKIDT